MSNSLAALDSLGCVSQLRLLPVEIRIRGAREEVLLVAATESRHCASLTASIFRFAPITISPEDAKRYHGAPSGFSFEDYERCVRFYAQLIRNAQP